MTQEQIALVQESFRTLIPRRADVAWLFYHNLFERDRSLEILLANADMREQGNKLMAALAFVVGALHDPAALREPLRALAIRHLEYGVQGGDYATVGWALLMTLEAGLSPAWCPEMMAAWSAAYAAVTDIMLAAVREHVSAAA